MAAREIEAGYYGWRVAAAAHVCLMLGFGLYACTFSVFLKPLTASFGWTRGAISTGFALSALAAAMFSPLIGRWLDRRGPRGVLLLSVSTFGATFAGFGLLSAHIWHFYVLCFLAGSVGNLIQMGYTQAISKWFDARRGLALGIMLAGKGVGLIIFPLASERLIAASANPLFRNRRFLYSVRTYVDCLRDRGGRRSYAAWLHI
jgi:MFS family permease